MSLFFLQRWILRKRDVIGSCRPVSVCTHGSGHPRRNYCPSPTVFYRKSIFSILWVESWLSEVCRKSSEAVTNADWETVKTMRNNSGRGRSCLCILKIREMCERRIISLPVVLLWRHMLILVPYSYHQDDVCTYPKCRVINYTTLRITLHMQHKLWIVVACTVCNALRRRASTHQHQTMPYPSSVVTTISTARALVMFPSKLVYRMMRFLPNSSRWFWDGRERSRRDARFYLSVRWDAMTRPRANPWTKFRVMVG